MLSATRQLLGSTQPLSESVRLGKKATEASIGPKYIFLHSPTQMNDTGPWLAKAYKEILAQERLHPSELGVVILHDDLEHSLGAVNTLSWAKSHQGHNGVKSIMGSLSRRTTEAPWVRIAIGIGRPAERDAKTVSEYVMRSFGKRQMELLDEKSEEVLQVLEELEEEWMKRVSTK